MLCWWHHHYRHLICVVYLFRIFYTAVVVALASWDYFLGLCLFFHMHTCSVFPSRCIPVVCFKDLRICDVLNEAALRLSSNFIRECVILFHQSVEASCTVCFLCSAYNNVCLCSAQYKCTRFAWYWCSLFTCLFPWSGRIVMALTN